MSWFGRNHFHLTLVKGCPGVLHGLPETVKKISRIFGLLLRRPDFRPLQDTNIPRDIFVSSNNIHTTLPEPGSKYGAEHPGGEIGVSESFSTLLPIKSRLTLTYVAMCNEFKPRLVLHSQRLINTVRFVDTASEAICT